MHLLPSKLLLGLWFVAFLEIGVAGGMVVLFLFEKLSSQLTLFRLAGALLAAGAQSLLQKTITVAFMSSLSGWLIVSEMIDG